MIFLNSLVIENKTLPDLQPLHNDLTSSPRIHPLFKIINIILYHMGKPYISKNSTLKPLFLQEFHSIPLGGLAGISKTLACLKQNGFGKACVRTLLSLFQLLLCVNRLSTLPRPPFGLLQPTTPPDGGLGSHQHELSLAYLQFEDKQLLWLWWVESQWQHILERYLVISRRARLQSCTVR